MDTPGFPNALWVAGDSDALRRTLQRDVLIREVTSGLGPLLQDSFSLGACHILRANLDPGRGLRLFIEASVLGPQGPLSTTIQMLWRKEVRRPPSEASFSMPTVKQEVRSGLGTPFKQLTRADREAGLLIQIAPFDSVLPRLPRLFSPTLDVIRLLTAHDARHPGPMDVSVIRYRPGKRHVIRYSLSDERRYFAKAYADGRARAIFSRSTLLADWLEAETLNCHLARPLALLDSDCAVLSAEAPGQTFTARLRAGVLSPGAWRAAGLMLATLHRIPPHVLPLKESTFDCLLDEVRSTTSYVAALDSALGAAVAGQLSRLSSLSFKLPSQPLGFAYGDFKTDHLFVEDDHLTLIDSDSACLAEPALDLGKFLADLSFWYQRCGLLGVAEAKAAFLDGYGLLAEDAMLRTRLYEVLILVRSIVRRVHFFNRGWPAEMKSLLAVGGQLLSELEAEVSATVPEPPSAEPLLA